MDESQLKKPEQHPAEPAARPAEHVSRPAETAVAPAPVSADTAPAAAAAPLTAPTGDAGLRASDADRDRVADILREALAEGRLDADEHSERLDGVYAAKTMGELAPLVRDLPAGRAAAPAPAAVPRNYQGDGSGENPTLVAVLSGAERKGRWRVGHKIIAVAVMGGVEIDLSEAVFTAPEVVIHCTAIMGGISVKVPENVTVRGGGVIGIMGGADIRSNETPDPGAPVVRFDGVAFWGGVEAKPKRGKKLKDWTKQAKQDPRD